MRTDTFDDLRERLGAIVPRIELERAVGKHMTEQLLESGEIVTVGIGGSLITAHPSLRDPRRR